MNIEQIKKDWEYHCEEYGLDFDIKTHISTRYDMTTDKIVPDDYGFELCIKQVHPKVHKLFFVYIWIWENGNSFICNYIDGRNLIVNNSDSLYKLRCITSFYEKLMEQENE